MPAMKGLRLRLSLTVVMFVMYNKCSCAETTEIDSSDLSCPADSINTQDRHDVEEFKGTGSAEECSKRCLKSETCNFWTWHHEDSGEWALECVLMSSYGNQALDSNAISGTRACILAPPSTILLESSGGAAEYQGSRLGYYDYEDLNQRPAFKQRGGDHYINYYEESGAWLVVRNDTLGGSTSGLYVTNSTSSTPASTGWKYHTGTGIEIEKYYDEDWVTDSTLRVDKSPSDPSSTCTNIKVAATGPAASAQPKMMGNYRWEGDWLNGHKIFKGGRDGDMYLRVPTGKTTWMIGSSRDSVGAGITSAKETTCPCNQASGHSVRYGLDGWVYIEDDGDGDVDRSISVTCV